MTNPVNPVNPEILSTTYVEMSILQDFKIHRIITM